MHFGGPTSPLLSWKSLKPRHTEPSWSPWGLQMQPRSFESPSAEWERQRPQQTSAALSRWSTLWLHWQRALNPLWPPASSRESPRFSSSGADTRKHWLLHRVDLDRHLSAPRFCAWLLPCAAGQCGDSSPTVRNGPQFPENAHRDPSLTSRSLPRTGKSGPPHANEAGEQATASPRRSFRSKRGAMPRGP